LQYFLIFSSAIRKILLTDYGLDAPGNESRWGKIFRPSS